MSTDLQTAAPARTGRWDTAAFVGVWTRELTLFRRLWPATTVSSIAEPTIYLLAFGFGFGALVSEINGIPYVEFLATGTVAVAVLFSSVFAGMFTTYVRRVYQRTYDAVLATPTDVHEVVLAEATWIGAKASVFGCAPLVVALFFGLDPTWGMLAIPAINFVTGTGFAMFGQWISGVVPSIDSFSYVTSIVITPLFLVAGTFFPLDNFPSWAQTLAQLNPLYHSVQLVRDAVFGWQTDDWWHLSFLIGFAALMGFLAIRRLRSRLIL